MFNEYFGFRENPFSENHDIDYYYLNNSNKQLYRDLLTDIYQRVDLTLLLADWGVGKTAFLQQLIGIDPFQIRVIYFHDTGQWHELVNYLCSEMALATDSHDSDGKEQLLVEHLTEIHQQGIIPVLIVDNAQELKDESLAPLLRLSGQRIDGQPLIQVILAAVPAFMSRFDLSVLHPYKSSISRHYQLKALTSIEVNDFIYFRLRQAGCKREDLFSDSAIQAIFDRSEGIPRLINKLCGSALMLASLDNHQTVDEEIIDKASKHCFLSPDFVEKDKIDDIPINYFSDKITPKLQHAHRFKDARLAGNKAAKQLYPWSSQLVRSAAAVVLTLLLAGTIILLKSNPEQRQKRKTEIDFNKSQSSIINKETNAKIPPGPHQEKTIGTIKHQDVVTLKNQNKIATIVSPKGMQPNTEASSKPDKERLTNSEALVAESPVRNPILLDVTPPHLPKAGTKDANVVQEIALIGKLEKSPSHENRLVPKSPSAQNDHSVMSEPTKLDRREQQAKNRASARLKLKQSDIEFGIEAFMTVAETADNKTLELLLEAGIPPDIQEQTQGLTALGIAASKGHSDTVQLLLLKAATTDLKDFKGRTALMAAAGKGYTDTVRVLLNNGAKININDHDGWTALMFAAYSNHQEATHVLLEWGANDRLKNSVGRTALQIARSRGHQDIIELVAERTSINRK